jgi:hypothetical protein
MAIICQLCELQTTILKTYGNELTIIGNCMNCHNRTRLDVFACGHCILCHDCSSEIIQSQQKNKMVEDSEIIIVYEIRIIYNVKYGIMAKLKCPTCCVKTSGLPIYGDNLMIHGICTICFELTSLTVLNCGHTNLCRSCLTDVIEHVYLTNSNFPITREELIKDKELYFLTSLEKNVPKLSTIVKNAKLNIETLENIHAWVVRFQVSTCEELLNSFDEIFHHVFRGIQSSETDIFLRELENSIIL